MGSAAVILAVLSAGGAYAGGVQERGGCLETFYTGRNRALPLGLRLRSRLPRAVGGAELNPHRLAEHPGALGDEFDAAALGADLSPAGGIECHGSIVIFITNTQLCG